ncbi:alpha/beta hydrolase [Hyphococcus sp. DH-69]|uniref:alpha/beta hydrolase n=1 Tax=Hyphococcus formosus TaxID=3143534 RepID=UPI00398B4413
MTNAPQFLQGPNGRIAYRKVDGTIAPGIIWLGGFQSDMLGTKAEHLSEWALSENRPYLRFDYTGHGESDGKFEDGCISEWAEDALAVFDNATEGPQILVGSSMGGWIATLLAQQRPERIAAIVFIAPAPDFTETLMWPSFTDAERNTINAEGRLAQPSEYSDEPQIITKKLIEDGRKNLVMNGPIPINCPVRVLQGMKDDAVPYSHALRFAEALATEDIEISIVKSGDHRLSTPADLERLTATIAAVS